MEREPLVELLIVEHTFGIDRNAVRMLILHPQFALPSGRSTMDWGERIESVVVVRPDGSEVEATAHIAVGHLNISGPNVTIEERWRITVWLTDRKSEEVPVGSRILVRREIRDAILPLKN